VQAARVALHPPLWRLLSKGHWQQEARAMVPCMLSCHVLFVHERKCRRQAQASDLTWRPPPGPRCGNGAASAARSGAREGVVAPQYEV